MADTTTSDALLPVVQFEPDQGIRIWSRPTTILPARLASRDAWRIPKGGTWLRYVTWYVDDEPVDLSSGYTATFTIAPQPGATAVLTLTESAGIALTASQPQNVALMVTAVQTAALAIVRGWSVLTITETAPGTVTRLLEAPVDLIG